MVIQILPSQHVEYRYPTDIQPGLPLRLDSDIQQDGKIWITIAGT